MQIDTGVISLLKDEELEKYIPKYGDRVAVTAFLRACTDEASATASTSDDSASVKRRGLIDRLKLKVKTGRTEHNLRSTGQHGNQNAQKETRHVIQHKCDTGKSGQTSDRMVFSVRRKPPR